MKDTVEHEHIWVPKEWAEAFKRATSEDAQIEVLKKIVANAKRSMESDLEALDEDAARFRGLLLGYKKAYSAVLDEHLAATYKVWEDIEAKMPNTKAMASKVASGFDEIGKRVQSVAEQIDAVAKRFESINTYQLERMVSLVQAIENADDKTRDILRLVLAAPKEPRE